MYISDCKSALLPFKKCTTVTISKPINRKECRYQNHLNYYHLVFLFLVQISELFEFSRDLKCRNCLSMLQLGQDTTFTEHLGNQKSRNPQIMFMKKIIRISQSKLWIKIRGYCQTLADEELSSYKNTSLTGVLGLYQSSIRPSTVFRRQCKVGQKFRAELKYICHRQLNKQLIDIYQSNVDLLCYEGEISNTVGSFIVREEKISVLSKSLERNAEKNITKLTSLHKDIRSFFVFQSKTGSKDSQTNVIELSDTEED